MALFCRDMKWTYLEYMEQPTWFIDILRMVKNIDAEYHNQMVKQSERQAKRNKR